MAAALPKSGWFLLSDLVRVESAPDHPDSFAVGDRAQLRSGGPAGLVVEIEEGVVTVAWGSHGERDYPAICLRRLI